MKFRFLIYFLLLICFIISNKVYAQKPAFTSSKTLPCLNDTVTFFDTSNHSYTSYSWTITPLSFSFINGTDQYSQNPKVQFTSPGYYKINLSVTDSLGTYSLTKNNYIYAGGLLLPYIENWENDSTYKNWSIENPDSSYTWTKYNVTGNGSSYYSIGVNNFNYNSARNSIKRDGLISPAINLNGYSSAILNFKHAYRRYDSIHQDSMAIYVSTNCGATWNRVTSYIETQNSSGYDFITNANLTTAFAPYTFIDWCGNIGYASCKTINLSQFLGNVIKIKFENISGNGNNLYLDDISVTGVSNMTAPVTDFNFSSTNSCSDDTVSFTDITTNNPSSWYWTFSPSNVSFVNGTNAKSKNPVVLFHAGTYSVSLTTTSITQSGNTKTKNIIISQTFTPTISIIRNGTSIICERALVEFNFSSPKVAGDNPYFAWQVNDSTLFGYSGTPTPFKINNLKKYDTVSCKIYSSLPCAKPSVVTSNKLVIQQVEPVPPIPHITQKGDTLFCDLINPGYIRYQWYMWFGGITNNWFAIQGAGQQFYIMGSRGNYYVDVYYNSACPISSSSINIINNLGLNDLNIISNLKLFPNPLKDKVTIEFELNESQQITFAVYDITGKKIIDESKDFLSGTNSHQLNFAALPKGVYYLQMKNKDGISMMQRSVVIE